MADIAELKFFPAVVCDDIRVEANGKHILAGVYPSDIIVPQFPATLVIAAWLPQYALKTGDFSIEIRSFVPGSDSPIAQIKGGGQVTGLGRGGLPVPAFPVTVASAGNIRIEVRANDGEWEEVASVPVKLGNIDQMGVPRSETKAAQVA